MKSERISLNPSSPTEETPIAPPSAIDALRRAGAETADPARFRFIEALARRAASYRGAARLCIDARLAAAVQACRARCEETKETEASAATEAQDAAPGPLAGLLERLDESIASMETSVALEAESLPVDSLDTASGAQTTLRASRTGELKAVICFRDSWVRLSVERQLAKARAQMPDNAGPLNSQWLMLRALQQMHDVSSAGLSRFLSYAEALLWLEQVGSPVPFSPNSSSDPPPKPVVAPRQRKSPR